LPKSFLAVNLSDAFSFQDKPLGVEADETGAAGDVLEMRPLAHRPSAGESTAERLAEAEAQAHQGAGAAEAVADIPVQAGDVEAAAHDGSKAKVTEQTHNHGGHDDAQGIASSTGEQASGGEDVRQLGR
jgi:hypothetical protein